MFDFTLLPLFVSIMILLLVVLAVGIHFWRNAVVMMLIIPLSLGCAFTTYHTVTNILGYPVMQQIPDESLYLSHIESLDGEQLYVWAIEPAKALPKNFRIPATEQNRKTMNDAKKRAKKGIKQVLKQGRDYTRSGEHNPGDYLRYDFKVDPQGLK